MAVWHPAPAIRALIAEANRLAPARSKAGDGTIGDAAHAQRASDHNPDPDGTVDAADLTHDPAGGWDCRIRFAQLLARRNRRIAYVIFARRWFRSYPRGGVPAWTVMPYRGHPHDHHMHVSVLDAHQDDMSPWFRAGAAPSEGGSIVDGLSANEREQLRDMLHAFGPLVNAVMEGVDIDRVPSALQLLLGIERRITALETQLAAGGDTLGHGGGGGHAEG